MPTILLLEEGEINESISPLENAELVAAKKKPSKDDSADNKITTNVSMDSKEDAAAKTLVNLAGGDVDEVVAEKEGDESGKDGSAISNKNPENKNNNISDIDSAAPKNQPQKRTKIAEEKEKEKEKLLLPQESSNLPGGNKDECNTYLNSLISGQKRTKNNHLPAFHHASDEIYKTVLLAFEHVHKNRIDWVTTDQIEVVDMTKAFTAAKEQLYQFLERLTILLMVCPNSFTFFQQLW